MDALRPTSKPVDLLIVGAGISGIGMAAHFTRECPRKSYAIVERRERLGGTWDLFRYPGIRSDSDMYTLGYQFEPWRRSSSSSPSSRGTPSSIAKSPPRREECGSSG